jgi:hypothetical protein
MAFEITITTDAESQMRALRVREQRVLEAAILARFPDRPTTPTRVIKKLRPNPFAEYELRWNLRRTMGWSTNCSAAARVARLPAADRGAAEAIPFGPAVGARFGEVELFHLAPAVALKLRGLPRSGRKLARATEAALASYLATRDGHPEVFADPHISFAFCYLASHHGLGLLGEAQTEEVMDYVERHRRPLSAELRG